MGVRDELMRPSDPRWKGSQNYFHKFFVIKNFLLIIFIILVIVDFSLLHKMWAKRGYDSDWNNAMSQFWFRIGLALVPDLVFTLITLILILNPLHHSTYSCHPIYALVISIIMFGLWPTCVFFNTIVVLSNEVGFEGQNGWQALAFFEAGLQAIIAIFYIAMLVASAKGVHRWRKSRKGHASTEEQEMA